MRIIILIVLVISGLTAVACSSEATSTADTQTASRPTADVPATVEAGVSGTREAETAIDATVGGESRRDLNHLHPNSYASARSNAPANKHPIAHLDSRTDEHACGNDLIP